RRPLPGGPEALPGEQVGAAVDTARRRRVELGAGRVGVDRQPVAVAGVEAGEHETVRLRRSELPGDAVIARAGGADREVAFGIVRRVRQRLSADEAPRLAVVRDVDEHDPLVELEAG